METWIDVKGYEGYYQISTMGRVKSLERTVIGKDGRRYSIEGQMMKNQKDKKGYEVVVFRKNGSVKSQKVHRLVASAFIKNIKNKPQVNHIDEVKTNNNVNNLEWVTAKENTHHGTKIARTSKPVVQIEEKTQKVIKTFPSVSSASKELGFSAGNIAQCARGERPRMYGYIWKYV